MRVITRGNQVVPSRNSSRDEIPWEKAKGLVSGSRCVGHRAEVCTGLAHQQDTEAPSSPPNRKCVHLDEIVMWAPHCCTSPSVFLNFSHGGLAHPGAFVWYVKWVSCRLFRSTAVCKKWLQVSSCGATRRPAVCLCIFFSSSQLFHLVNASVCFIVSFQLREFSQNVSLLCLLEGYNNLNFAQWNHL